MKNKDIRILLVDDEPDILEIIGYNLSAEGYQIITAETGVEGVKKAKKEKPHLIILDVMMPEMDGIEACEKIRKIKSLENEKYADASILNKIPFTIQTHKLSTITYLKTVINGNVTN